MIPCSKCGTDIHPLEVFPDNYCLACHAERWEAEPKPTAQQVIKMFKNSVQL